MKNKTFSLLTSLLCINKTPDIKLIGYTDILEESKNQSDEMFAPDHGAMDPTFS